MSSAERREQLITVARSLFAARGFEGTSVEEIAATAHVSKPVVYEHFGGKEGVYAVVVDREVRHLTEQIRSALTTADAGPRDLIELGTLALLDYVEANPDGFRIISRDSPVGATGGSFATILSDVASKVQDILEDEFSHRDYDPKSASLYAQALVGLVGFTGQWWLEERRPDKRVVAAHLVNLAWHGMAGLKPDPVLHSRRRSD